MRIIFVGMNNKQGFEPLDSRTKSGKLIDRLIHDLQTKLNLFGWDFIKTNLYDSNEWPSSFSESDCMDWWIRVGANPNDIIITLGEGVYKRFKKLKPIKLGHPSACWSHDSQKEYIKRGSQLVKDLVNREENG